MQQEKQDTWPIGLDRQPTGVDEAAFVAANATLIGDVQLSEAVSIWYGAILRGDLSPIVIGRRSNIQDGAILHGDPGQPTLVGEEVTIGHRAVIHSAHIEGGCLIGIGAIILNRGHHQGRQQGGSRSSGHPVCATPLFGGRDPGQGYPHPHRGRDRATAPSRSALRGSGASACQPLWPVEQRFGRATLSLFCQPSLNSRDPRRAPRYLCCRPPGRSSPPGIPS